MVGGNSVNDAKHSERNEKTKPPADLAEEGLGGLDEAAVLVEGPRVRRRDLAPQPPDRRQPPRHVALRPAAAQVLPTAGRGWAPYYTEPGSAREKSGWCLVYTYMCCKVTLAAAALLAPDLVRHAGELAELRRILHRGPR